GGVARFLAFDAKRLRVLRRAVDAHRDIALEDAAGHQVGGGIRVPDAAVAGEGRSDAEDWKRIECFAREIVAQFATLGSQQRGFFGHREDLRLRAYLESDIDAISLGSLHHKTLANVFLESRHGDVD